VAFNWCRQIARLAVAGEASALGSGGTDMSIVLEKIRKLISLTDSPFEEEARSAAMLAIRLIKEHKILDSIPMEPKPKKVAPSKECRSSLRVSAYAKIARFLDFLRRKATEGLRPFYGATEFANRSVETGEIQASDRAIFLYYLRQALREHTTKGNIEYQNGKGYRLHYALMWAEAA